MIQFYYDSRSSGHGMGDAVEMQGTSLVNVWEKNRPSFKCQHELRDNYLLDIDGVLGPSDKGRGYIVRNRNQAKAFLPPDACTPLWYSGSNQWGECSAFCEGTFCLRFMRIKPYFGEWTTHTDMTLLLSNGDTEFEYSSAEYKFFHILLPAGRYHGRIFKADGTELIAKVMEVIPIGDKPLCEDFVTPADFTFSTFPPTLSPSLSPTTTSSPSVTPDPIVRVQSMINKKYLWVAESGGLKTSLDPNPATNTAITLKKHPCVQESPFYHYDSGISSPCFQLVWENANGRRLFAQSTKEWAAGVGTSAGNFDTDQLWFLEKAQCNSDFEDGTCGIIRNARNGRSLYDHIENHALGASPSGEPPYIWTNLGYVWQFMDLVTGNGLDLANVASEPMFTTSPTLAPISSAPTLPDRVVRIKSELTGYYLWTRADGGFKANIDELPLTNTAINLVRYACPSSGSYHFDSGLTSPCYLVKFEAGGRRMFAQTGKTWRSGIGAKTGTIYNNQVWFFQATNCIDGAAGTCTLIRNAVNGRTMYHNDALILGASPGSTTDYTWPSQKFHVIDETGVAIDVTGLQ